MRTFSVVILGAAAFLGISGCGHNSSVKGNIPPLSTAPQLAELKAVPISPMHCSSVEGLPDSTCTPGAVRTTDVNSICNGGSTKQWRPATSYTNDLKQKGIVAYAYADTDMADYEEDHLISLEIGGDGSDPKNLWPESHTGKYNSFVKDQVENWLHDQICKTKTMTPKEAQDGISTDWRQYIPQVLASKSSHSEVQ